MKVFRASFTATTSPSITASLGRLVRCLTDRRIALLKSLSLRERGARC